MGHKYLQGMARTPALKHVVALLGHSAGIAGTAGIGPGGIREIADATLQASQAGLQRAKSDEGLAFCVYLMAQVTLAARTSDFASALSQAGISPPPQSGQQTQPLSIYHLIGSFTAAVDKHLRSTRSRTDITELAQLAASESLVSLCRPRAETLFGTSIGSIQDSLRSYSTKKGFANLTHDFFARFTKRYLEYHLSRELSNHVGPKRRFASAKDHNDFLKQLDTHCRVTTGVMRRFAGDWYSKHNFQQDLTFAKTKGFTAHAIDKVRDALRYQEERDGN